MENRTRIELPHYVQRPFEVFLNGVPQKEGTDYELVGSSLLFPQALAREGELGFWRWARMVLGIAGTYRKNDSVDVVFTHEGRRRVATLRPSVTADEAEEADPVAEELPS